MSKAYVYLKDDGPAHSIVVDVKPTEPDSAVDDSFILTDNAGDMDTVDVVVEIPGDRAYEFTYQFHEDADGDGGEWERIA